MLTGSQRNGLGDTIREETCSCGLTRWQHADLAASYILSIKATNKLVHEKIYFSAAVSYLHLSLFHCCIFLCSVNLRRAGKKGLPACRSSLLPLTNSKIHTKDAKMCQPAVSSSHSCHCGSWDAVQCRQGPGWRASLWEGDKRGCASPLSQFTLTT